MKHFDRRKFIKRTTSAACLAVMPPLLRAEQRMPANSLLTINPNKSLFFVPRDFTGLSYESMQLEDSEFFSPTNHQLIHLFRQLGTGVLRLGGNTAEFTYWSPNKDAKVPEIPPDHAAPGNTTQLTAITPHAIDNLDRFLDAANWSCIYGLNLGIGSAQSVADEAAYVAETLGAKLLYFQIGNEPNMFAHTAQDGRRSTEWTFADYMPQWLAIAHAVLKRVPQARFGGPDGGALWRWKEWVGAFSEEMPAQLPNALAAITTHYYPLGPPQDPSMTLERLLRRNPKVDQWIAENMNAANEAHLPFRMTETNSCYNGGKPGLSNTLGSALWGGDYMLRLAHAGAVGINFHLGGARQIRTSLSGKLPGEAVDTSAVPAQDAYYSPITGSRAEGFCARPLYYGMLLAGQFAGHNLVSAELSSTIPNATAYAARTSADDAHDAEVRVAIFNKDMKQDLKLEIDPGFHTSHARTWVLVGPSVFATDNITLAGSTIRATDNWTPQREQTLEAKDGKFSLSVPAGTAILMFLR